MGKRGPKRKFHVNDAYFDIIGPNQAYFLGLLMADGYVTGNEIGFYISSKDVELLENLNKELDSTYKIKYQKGAGRNLGKEYVRLRIISPYLINRLKELGIVERKTGKEILPTECKIFKYDFLRGLFDGDGTVGTYPNGGYWHRHFTIYSSSELFLNQLKETFEIGYTFFKSNHACGQWVVSKKSHLYNLYHNLYENCDKLFLKRKKTTFEELMLKMNCEYVNGKFNPPKLIIRKRNQVTGVLE